jgi:hypothetical protein
MPLVKYVGPAMERVIARADLGTEVPDDEAPNLVWDGLNGHVEELTDDEYEQLQRLTDRRDWAVVEEAPDVAISGEELEAVNDQTTYPIDSQEDVGSE